MAPLQGIRVVELTLNISGALTGQILAGLGAQVVKVERPGTGDDCRSFGPPFVRGASVMYNGMNRGKSSVTLDLKTPQAIEWLHGASRTRFGARHGLGNQTMAIAGSATRVLPLPVGSTTTPRRSARVHAASASRW